MGYKKITAEDIRTYFPQATGKGLKLGNRPVFIEDSTTSVRSYGTTPLKFSK
jgi:hypothetical protein